MFAGGGDPARLAAHFREAFLIGLWKLWRAGELTFAGELAWIRHVDDFRQWLEPIEAKDWHMHCQGPPPGCEGGTAVLKYLARYVVGSAISDARLLEDDGEQLLIGMKNYRTDQQETLQLTGEAFVKRYVMHILPPYLQRVRYGGIFGNRYRKATLAHCRTLLGLPQQPEALAEEPADPWEPEQADESTGPVCPRCAMPNMESLGRYTPTETLDFLTRLTRFWHAVATVILTLPCEPTSPRSCSSSAVLDHACLGWIITTNDIDDVTQDDVAFDLHGLPPPDT